MNALRHQPITEPNERLGAAWDILAILGALYVVKWAMLRVDAMWTYAGPVALLMSAIVATFCLRRHGERWVDLGLARPANIPRMLAWSLLILVVTLPVGSIIEAGITSAGIAGGDVDPRYAHRFADLPGNLGNFLYWLSVSWVVGGFVEEMLFRAALITRFERLFGRARLSTWGAVMLQAIIFGQQHFYYQGWSGALATGGLGLISGALYIYLDRKLWPLVLSHGLGNSFGLTLIFLGTLPAG